VDRLDNVVQPYAWGCPDSIPRLLGRPPTGAPQAELWLGAHHAAPSRVLRDGETPTLAEVVARDPHAALGADSRERFGDRLPFLLKVLAAVEPLSLQAHPSAEQARRGFARENRLGIPLDAPHRSYKDDSHKPELIAALTEFHALSGFREPRHSVELLRALEIDHRVLAEQGLAAYFESVMGASAEERAVLATRIARACETRAPSAFERECAWASRIASKYPGDVGVVGALLLNLVTLEPGQAIALPAGNLHAYLSGVGVEIMASSDNVLRGGLTPKHVDVPELLQVLDFRPFSVEVSSPSGDVVAYPTPSAEFELTRVRASEAQAVLDRRGPDILLCVEGSVTVTCGTQTLELEQGASAFVAASEGPRLTIAGSGVAFRATTGR
jgi:mannose-6-phosphate isomerase